MTTPDDAPDFDALHGAEPLCITALIRQGGLQGSSFEVSAKVLASYCVTSRLKASRIQVLAVRLADGFAGSSLRDAGQRQRYITSICQQQPDTVESFTCERMRHHRLAAEGGLRFTCTECAACPQWIC